GIGLMVAVAAVWLAFRPEDGDGGSGQQATLSEPARAPAAASAPQPAPATSAVAPAFDIVRINPDGNAVMAGRAMPKAEVVSKDGGRELGRVSADNLGEWVFVPEPPLAPGTRELRLTAANPDGRTVESGDPVVLSVPEGKAGQALAV